MAQYINKAAVVAWIESKIKNEGWCEVGKDTADVYYARGVRFTCETLKYFLDTIEVKEVVEHDYSDLNRELEAMGIDPNSRYAKMLKEAIYNADDVLRRRKNARRAAIKSHIDKLWVAGDIIHLKDADQEKAEAFILSLAEYGYDTNKLLNEYKQTGKITI